MAPHDVCVYQCRCAFVAGTSFKEPDKCGKQYQTMLEALNELIHRNGWNRSMVMVWVGEPYASLARDESVFREPRGWLAFADSESCERD